MTHEINIVPHNILTEFCVSIKLVRLIKMFLKTYLQGNSYP